MSGTVIQGEICGGRLSSKVHDGRDEFVRDRPRHYHERGRVTLPRDRRGITPKPGLDHAPLTGRHITPNAVGSRSHKR